MIMPHREKVAGRRQCLAVLLENGNFLREGQSFLVLLESVEIRP